MAATNYFLNVLTPLADDAESKLHHLETMEKKLEYLRMAGASPFEQCETVHMARFVVIDELPLQLGDTRREFLSRNYLLFIAELSGDAEDFFDELYEHHEEFVRWIWGHCAGFPRSLIEARDGEDGESRARYRPVYFRRYMRRHEIKTLIPFAGIRDVSVRDIKRAIETQSRVTKFIEEHAPWHTSDTKLYADWLAAQWPR